MRNVLILFLVICAGCVPLSCSSPDDFTRQVKTAVASQMKEYPASTLCDLYKNFFQDKFGPGHLLADTIAAKNYLLREIETMQDSKGAVIAFTGWEHNFYRVNLSLLKEGKIPFKAFFDAFLESMNGVEIPKVSEWREEWAKVVEIVERMNLDLPDFEVDKQRLDDMLAGGKYAVHHSEAYVQLYAPHYRLIRKDVFEKRLKHYIPGSL